MPTDRRGRAVPSCWLGSGASGAGDHKGRPYEPDACRSDIYNVDVVDMLGDLNHSLRMAVANSTGQYTEVPMATTLISVPYRTSIRVYGASTRTAECHLMGFVSVGRAFERSSITWRHTSD